MNFNTPNQDDDRIVREAFVLIAFRLLCVQLLLALVYFGVVELTGLIDNPLGWRRPVLFMGLQTFQIAFSLYVFARWLNHWYQITDNEVVCHRGIFYQSSDYYSLDRLESASLKQSLLGLLLGYGTIKLMIHHSDHRDQVYVRNIRHPRQHVRVLQQNLKRMSANLSSPERD